MLGQKDIEVTWTNVEDGIKELRRGSLYLGHILCSPHLQESPWRAWLSNTQHGTCLGWFETEQAAGSALEVAAGRALMEADYIPQWPMA